MCSGGMYKSKISLKVLTQMVADGAPEAEFTHLLPLAQFAYATWKRKFKGTVLENKFMQTNLREENWIDLIKEDPNLIEQCPDEILYDPFSSYFSLNILKHNRDLFQRLDRAKIPPKMLAIPILQQKFLTPSELTVEEVKSIAAGDWFVLNTYGINVHDTCQTHVKFEELSLIDQYYMLTVVPEFIELVVDISALREELNEWQISRLVSDQPTLAKYFATVTE